MIAMTGSRRPTVTVALAVLALGIAACGDDEASPDSRSGTSPGSGSGESSSPPPVHSDLSGLVRVDGSRVIAPLTEAVAEGFKESNPRVGVAVGTAGTGAGFESLCASKADISDAAWLFDERVEQQCAEAGIAYRDAQVATEVLVVMVNKENPVGCLTVAQLAAIWGADSKISSWDEIPDLKEEFDEELALSGPAIDSASFEYFTEAITGVAGGTREDYNDVGDDEDATVAAVEDTLGGMGFANFSSFRQNEDKVKALEVDDGKGCVGPSAETAQDGSYAPLSRPLLLYLSDRALKRPEVKAFVDYYLENVGNLAESAGFVPLTEKQLAKSKAEAKKVGA